MLKISDFRNLEKDKYFRLKSELFSKEAQTKGTYRHHLYNFCLADGYSEENIYFSFRNEAIRYFTDRHIPWHDGCNDRRLPSNHLCCSQSSCVNFLFPMVMNEKLIDPSRLKSVAVEDMLEIIGKSRGIADDNWVNYLQKRYSFN